MIRKLLIANRGEIACRIARTCRRLGVQVATVHSSADRDALHVRQIGESVAIGGAAATESYLNIATILDAARAVGADALHPGIGFLAEEPRFAETVEAQGLIFVGPRPETMRRFGDKWSAKREAREAGVPVIGGGEGSSDDAAAVERMIRETLSLPVVLKAAAGGGGRGVRIVRSLDGLLASIESAMREAQSSFGRPDLIVEEFVENARHLEVQVAGDGQGAAIHLFERECSLQRRFQKVIEEAPSCGLKPELRERILADAVKLARRIHYRNLGTMEFLVSGGRHYFLECNPRLQVEHTVTEEVTGLDLVELQLAIAMQSRLPLAQEQITIRGHAVQARVNAENPGAGFIPSTGRLEHVEFPADVRVETGVASGSEITPHYDSMIAKLIARGADRTQALDRLQSAVERSVVFGVDTNLAFLSTLLRHPVVRAGEADNRFIDREFSQAAKPALPARELVATAAALMLRQWNVAASGVHLGLWAGEGELLGWQYDAGTNDVPNVPAFSLTAAGGHEWAVAVGAATAAGLKVFVDGAPVLVELQSHGQGRWQVGIGSRQFTAVARLDHETADIRCPLGTARFSVLPFLSLDAAASSKGGQLLAPMMGVVAKVKVKVGDAVKKGEVLLVQESMKMELNIESPCDGTVAAVNCAERDMVERHQVLIDVTPEITDGSAS